MSSYLCLLSGSLILAIHIECMGKENIQNRAFDQDLKPHGKRCTISAGLHKVKIHEMNLSTLCRQVHFLNTEVGARLSMWHKQTGVYLSIEPEIGQELARISALKEKLLLMFQFLKKQTKIWQTLLLKKRHLQMLQEVSPMRLYCENVSVIVSRRILRPAFLVENLKRLERSMLEFSIV